MGKADKKTKAAEKKARNAQKQEKKASQKEKKRAVKKKSDNSNDDEEDVDLDAVLADFAKQQEAFLKITETPSDPPSARGSATLIASPSNDNELFLFGGEYYNGALARFFNDLFVYKINRDQWLRVTSPNSPLPRSGHAWCRGGNAGGIYLFGGEFSSPKQGTFYHYNDFWYLEPSTREWTKLESKGKGPPARSGHRMTYFKNYIVLFGGFQDTSQQTKYLQDLWLYDCTNYVWHNPPLPLASAKPDPRSSFTFLPHESGAAMYGGYSRVKKAQKTRPTKGAASGAVTQSILTPLVHQDSWFLRITPPTSDAPANSPPKVRWEMRKRPANAPAPPRAGATMAHHKGRGIQFGGVHDVEESEEGIDSEFFNTLYVWNIERNRYFPLGLRRPRAGAKKPVSAAAERTKGGRGRKDEEELLANLARLEAKGGLSSQDEAPSNTANSKDDDTDDEPKIEKPILWEMPHPRFNAQLTVQDDVLYIFGGTFEKDDREFTFDEMYAIDLGKLDGAREIFRRELEDWAGSDSEDDEDDEDEEDEEDDDEKEGHDNNDEEDETTAVEVEASPLQNDAGPRSKAKPRLPSLIPSELTSPPSTDGPPTPSTDLSSSEPASSALSDNLPHPRPFESLREFYARTGEAWQEVILIALRRAAGTNIVDGSIGEFSIKEVRKRAFERAEAKWWDCREEIQVIEDEQEAAGIGEVVSLAEKQAAGGASGPGVGRRM